MPFCTKCGGEVPEEAQFCPTCGAPRQIETTEHPPTPSQAIVRSSSLFDRMIRAARLESSLYEEVERDETATTQAMTVVIISSLCSGIGSALSQAIQGESAAGIGLGLVGGLITALIGWLIWAFITYFIGTNFFGGTASFGELLRTIGFSNAPGVLLITSFIPIIGGIVWFIASLWGLVSMVVAVRQALDFSTGTAILTCIVGLFAYIVLFIIMGIIFAIPFVLLGS